MSMAASSRYSTNSFSFLISNITSQKVEKGNILTPIFLKNRKIQDVLSCLADSSLKSLYPDLTETK